MRGKAEQFPVDHGDSGITPAYAGKRLLTICDGNDIEDHPRLCGEKRGTGSLERNHEGSPPPMRGKV